MEPYFVSTRFEELYKHLIVCEDNEVFTRNCIFNNLRDELLSDIIIYQLMDLKQKPEEPMIDYIEKFENVSCKVCDLSDNRKMHTFITGLSNELKYYITLLGEKPPQTYREATLKAYTISIILEFLQKCPIAGPQNILVHKIYEMIITGRRTFKQTLREKQKLQEVFEILAEEHEGNNEEITKIEMAIEQADIFDDTCIKNNIEKLIEDDNFITEQIQEEILSKAEEVLFHEEVIEVFEETNFVVTEAVVQEVNFSIKNYEENVVQEVQKPFTKSSYRLSQFNGLPKQNVHEREYFLSQTLMKSQNRLPFMKQGSQNKERIHHQVAEAVVIVLIFMFYSLHNISEAYTNIIQSKHIQSNMKLNDRSPHFNVFQFDTPIT